jgi:hypothetical protein
MLPFLRPWGKKLLLFFWAWAFYSTVYAAIPFSEAPNVFLIDPILFRKMIADRDFFEEREWFELQLSILKYDLPEDFFTMGLLGLDESAKMQNFEALYAGTKTKNNFLSSIENFDQETGILVQEILTRVAKKTFDHALADFIGLDRGFYELINLIYGPGTFESSYRNYIEMEYLAFSLEKLENLPQSYVRPISEGHCKVLRAVFLANHQQIVASDREVPSDQEGWLSRFFQYAEKDEEDLCPCFDPFELGQAVVNVCPTCKPSLFHKECFDRYRAFQKNHSKCLRCPTCSEPLTEPPVYFHLLPEPVSLRDSI